MAIGANDAAAVMAFNRFGLGPRRGGLSEAAGDPRGFLLEELWTADVALVRDRAPPSGPEALQAYYLQEQGIREERARVAAAAMQTAALTPTPPAGPKTAEGPLASRSPGATAAGPSMAPSARPTMVEPGKPGPAMTEPPKKRPVQQAQFLAEAEARLVRQLEARAGLVERLVAFWSNHFAVSVAKSGALRAEAGPFEREAIRPNVLGKFSTLLIAAELHPAMIFFLDNQNSIGPDAAPGRFAGKGLNENLAREIMELHTLGVGSGYTQADVTEFARVLTGWSVAGPNSESGATGAFDFKPNWHEPGGREILGRTYPQAGVGQGRAVLDDLARHPATAKHIALKLVRHSSPTTRRPISSPRLRAGFRTATAISRSSSRRSSRTTAPGPFSAARSARRSNSSSPRRGRPVFNRTALAFTCRRWVSWACRSGSRPAQTAFRTSATRGPRRRA